MDLSFEGAFTDEDWEHTLGGTHVFIMEGSAVLSHAALVERTLLVGEMPHRTGYVEGVATAPSSRRRGLASKVMRRVNELVQERFVLGALSTNVPELYLPLGWQRWVGPTFAETPKGTVRTEDDDDGVMVFLTQASRSIDLSSALTCDRRHGDVW